MMKILSIGNGFSQDAHRWLYWLAVLTRKPVTIGDLPGADSGLLEVIRRTVNQI